MQKLHLDISDITEAEKIVKEISNRLDTFDLPTSVVVEYEDVWKLETPKILRRKSVQLYHVCRQQSTQQIQKYGIYHDPSPTLTLSLLGAFVRRERYHSLQRQSHILQINVPRSEIKFCKYDLMGPGFLPTSQQSQSEIPKEALPGELIYEIFSLYGSKKAYWLDPKYITKVLS